MVSSLANDSTNVNEVVLKMIESAELLYIDRNYLLKLTEEM